MELGKFDLLAGIVKQEVENINYTRNSGSTYNIGSSSAKSHAISPLWGIIYKPNDKLSIYASHSEDFDKGTVVSSYYENSGAILDPAKTKQNEVGIRYNSGKILSTLAFFDIKNQNSMVVEREGKNYLTNDGKRDYKGIDWSIYGKIAPKWNIMAGFLYLDAKVEKSTGGTLDGKRINGEPKWSTLLGFEYEPNNKFSILARGTFSGRYTIKNEMYELPSYFLVDLGVKYKTQIHKTPVIFNAMCYNVFDKACWESLPGGDNLILSMPRTFSLSATFSF